MPLHLKIAPRLLPNIHPCTNIITYIKDILGTLVQAVEPPSSEHAPSASSEVCTWDLLIDKQLAVGLTNPSAAVQSHAPVTETLPVHYLHFPVRKDKPHPLTWRRSFIAACSISFSCFVFYFFFTGTLRNNSSEDSLFLKPSGSTPPRLHSQRRWHGFKYCLDTGHKMADPGSVPAVSERDLFTQWWGMQICTPTQELPGGEWEGDRLLWLVKGKYFKYNTITALFYWDIMILIYPLLSFFTFFTQVLGTDGKIYPYLEALYFYLEVNLLSWHLLNDGLYI